MFNICAQQIISLKQFFDLKFLTDIREPRLPFFHNPTFVSYCFMSFLDIFVKHFKGLFTEILLIAIAFCKKKCKFMI